ncbi:MAG TPA: helix-turn-helix transcriptional regulator [Bryobacteraceae bacterium]|nr:helix-turn-helix transcriptional regulator [Bryobacteraceae bacterium]
MARSLATTYGSGYVIDTHCHPWHQLLYATTGAMTVSAGRMTWMVPPLRAVLIPSGICHSIRMWGEVAMRSLYFPASFPAPALSVPECRVISVTPLLRELILRTVELTALDSRVESETRLMNVLMDELHAASITPLVLPMPVDSRALAAAERVLKDPAAEMSLDVLARQCGVGSRTLERLFRVETGLRFGLWRQKARLLESLRVLVQGESVTDAALEAGYSSVSAYIAAFKRTFGCTPGALVTNPTADLSV